jgi:hypothetical protein
VSELPRPFETFCATAAEYCALIEGIERLDRREALRRLSQLLPGLMFAAAHLPETDPSDEDLGHTIPDDSWSERFSALNEAMGDHGAYWTTTDTRSTTEPAVVLLPVADDLADIWRDLKPGVEALAAGARQEDVTWEWRFSFETHWGAHAAEAIRAVHTALRD